MKLLALILLFVTTLPLFAVSTVLIQGNTRTLSNYYPFGGSMNWLPYMGFVYKNIPAFDLQVGDTLSFDLGLANDYPITVDIALAQTTTNGGNTENSNGFVAIATQQTPQNPYGDSTMGNYELIFTAQQAFHFTGGGLIIRVSNPGGTFINDTTGTQVLVNSDPSDSSGYFVGRFYRDADGLGPFTIAADTVANVKFTMQETAVPELNTAWLLVLGVFFWARRKK